jgi:predicted dehydrogenase
MKALVIGLGSIGRRQASLLAGRKGIELRAFRSDPRSGPNDLGLPEMRDWSEASRWAPFAAFICNPTYLHLETARRCAELGCPLFIEKPLGAAREGLDELLEVVGRQGIATYVAYNLRFHPVIERLRQWAGEHPVLHARIVCTSHLGLWRPAAAPLKTYSAYRSQGGGAMLDLSHELDYADWILDGITKIDGRLGRRGRVTEDAEDCVDLLLEGRRGWADVHLNVLSHQRQRTIQIDAEDMTVAGDLVDASLSSFHHHELVEKTDYGLAIQDTYDRQIDYFLAHIDDSRMMNNVFAAAELLRKMIGFKDAHEPSE